jgi:hypothetical protein
MDIGDALRRTGKDETIIQSIIWNSIVSVFQEEKNIDIRPYLVSVRFSKNIAIVKTKKPIINSEALLINDIIKKVSIERLSKIGIQMFGLEIKYI